MAYAFDLNDTTLQSGLRRIVRAELGSVLSLLPQSDKPEAVHTIRKHLKKTRALLRLVRSGFDGQPAENAALRTIALAFAARRDAATRLTVFDSLFPDPPVDLRPLRGHLVTDSQPSVNELPSDLSAAVKMIRKRAATWTLHGKDNRILRQGLADTRRQAIRAAKAFHADPASATLLHDWRKRVKDHWYQARLFAPCWPDLFKPIVDSADALGQALGDHHDLSLFADHIAGLPAGIAPPPARRLLDTAISAAQARIEDQAFPLAARLFAGNPDEVATLWVDWRAVWRTRA